MSISAHEAYKKKGRLIHEMLFTIDNIILNTEARTRREKETDLAGQLSIIDVVYMHMLNALSVLGDSNAQSELLKIADGRRSK